MTAAELEHEHTNDDNQEDEHHDGAEQARKIAGYLIIAGVLIAAGCIAFIVWEQYQANRAALSSNVAPFEPPYPQRDPPSDPNPQDQPRSPTSSENLDHPEDSPA